MIVLIKMKSGEIKKAMIRNKIFAEVNQINKKTDAITSSNIQSVFWPNIKEMKEVPIKEWVDMVEENNYFGLI